MRMSPQEEDDGLFYTLAGTLLACVIIAGGLRFFV